MVDVIKQLDMVRPPVPCCFTTKDGKINVDVKPESIPTCTYLIIDRWCKLSKLSGQKKERRTMNLRVRTPSEYWTREVTHQIMTVNLFATSCLACSQATT